MARQHSRATTGLSRDPASPTPGGLDSGPGPGLLPWHAASPSSPALPARSLLKWVVSVRAVVVVLAMLAVSLGVLWMQSAGVQLASAQLATADPPKVAIPPVGTGTAGATNDATARAGPAASSSAAAVMVHVAGRVKKPGVVTLVAGSRVFEALAAAGGALPDAALDAINLAAVAADGQQILVPSKADVAAGTVPAPASSPGKAGAGDGSGTVPGPGGALVNINTATAEELTRLPRVGPVLAQRIVQWRADHGKFTSIDQLDAVSGIGAKMLESLRGLVTF